MTKKIINILVPLVAVIASLSARAAAPTVKVTLDSAYIVMGQVTALHVSVVQDANAKTAFVNIPDTIMTGVEKHSELTADTTDLGSGRIEIKRDIVIQSFDSGLYMLPPVRLISGAETIASNQVALKVLPVAVDSMKTVHDYAPVQDVDRKWLDYIPAWVLDYGIWILIALILIAGAIWAFFRYRGKSAAVKPRKVEPPYVVAMRQLKELDTSHLCRDGNEKEYYTRLTEILRVYLQNRFGINALEMTTAEIIDAVNADAQAKPSRQYMQQVLNMADFVKFARMRPLPDDNAKAYASALRFVEDTNPALFAPEPEPDNNTSTPAGTESPAGPSSPKL